MQTDSTNDDVSQLLNSSLKLTSSVNDDTTHTSHEHADLAGFLNFHRPDEEIDQQRITHVSLAAPKGKFTWDRDYNEEFWQLYQDTVFHNPQKCVALAEKPDHYYPVLIDVDIKVPYDPSKHTPGPGGTRLYTPKQAETVIKIYQSILKECMQSIEEKHLFVLLLEKTSARVDNTWFKDGFHAHFLFTQLHQDDHRAEIFPRVKTEMKLRKVFESSGLANSEDAVDNVNGKPWLLYGSRKAEHLEAYKLTRLYGLMDAKTRQLSSFDPSLLKSKLTEYGHVLKDADGNELNTLNKPFEYFLPRLLSIIPVYNKIQVSQLKKTLNVAVLRQMEKFEDLRHNNKFQNLQDLEEDLRQASSLMPLLSSKRASEYSSWLEVGFTLFDISQGCDVGFRMWLDFSKRTTANNYSERNCALRWTSMKPRNKTIGSLIHFARTDSPEAWLAMKARTSSTQLEKCISGLQYDVAVWVHEMYQDTFVCVCPKKSIWYKFKMGQWALDSGSALLRKNMSTTLFNSVAKKASDPNVSVSTKKDYEKLMSNLKTYKYKRELIKECLAQGSQILLADGTTLAIEKLAKMGTNQYPLIMSCDLKSGALVHDSILHVVSKKKKKCFEVKLLDGKQLVCTGDHPILTFNEGVYTWINAKDLNRTHMVMTSINVPSFELTSALYDNSLVYNNCSSCTLQEIADLNHVATKYTSFLEFQSKFIGLYPIINSCTTKNNLINERHVQVSRSCKQDAEAFMRDLLFVCPWLECKLGANPNICFITFVSDHDACRFLDAFDLHSTTSIVERLLKLLRSIIGLSSSSPHKQMYFKIFAAGVCSNSEVKLSHQAMRAIDPVQVKFQINDQHADDRFHEFITCLSSQLLQCLGLEVKNPKQTKAMIKLLPYPHTNRIEIDVVWTNHSQMNALEQIAAFMHYDLITRIRLHLVRIFSNIKSPDDSLQKCPRLSFKQFVQDTGSTKYWFDEVVENMQGSPSFAVPVAYVKPLTKTVETYDMSVQNHKNMVANGFITHNCETLFEDDKFMGRLNNNFDLLNFNNGVMDLNTFEFRKTAPKDYISLSTGYDYREYTMESKEVKDVENYLSEILPDPTLRVYAVEYFANCLRGSNAHKRFMVMSGHGHGGKSVFMELIKKMLGDYYTTLPTSLITNNKPGSAQEATPAFSRLPGLRMVHMEEPNHNEVINLGELKRLTGQDSLWCRPLFQDGYIFRPQFHICMSCNEFPRVPVDDGAFWNRMRVIMFEALFLLNPADVPKTREEQMKKKIFPRNLNCAKAHAKFHQPLMWLLVQTLKRINKHGVSPEPEKVHIATTTYRKDNDTVIQFIEDRIWTEDPDSEITIKELYEDYKNWMRVSNTFVTALSKKKFVADITRRWGQPLAEYKWKGFRVKTDEDLEIKASQEEQQRQALKTAGSSN